MGRFFASQAVVCQLAYAESNLGNSLFPAAFLASRGRKSIAERHVWWPDVPVFLVGPRRAALSESPHRWLGIGLRVSPCLSSRSSEGSSLRPSLILLFGRSAVYFDVGPKGGHSALTVFARLAAFETNALSPPALHHVPRSKVNAFNAFNAFNACSRASYHFLSAAASSCFRNCSSCTFLPFRQPLPASSSCLRDAVSATPPSPTPKAQAQPNSGDL